MSDQNALTVTILERDYLVACPAGQEANLTEAARSLDLKMKEIRESGKVFGVERIAVMAALNLTHEVMRNKPDNKQDQATIARLNDTLDSLLPKA